jgi:Transposase, Mutator family
MSSSGKTGHWSRCIGWCSFDALRVKIRDEGTVKNKAVYLALGIQRDGTKEVLGLWIAQSEGAKFWLGVMNELKNRGLKDLLIAVIDGLKGFPEAISAVYPDCEIQTCIVHLIRTSLSFCNWKERKPVATELRAIYSAETAELAAKRLEDLSEDLWVKRFRQSPSADTECGVVSAFLCAGRFSFRNGKLGRRQFPSDRRILPFFGDVAQRQIDQLSGCLIARKMAPGFEHLA